MTCHSRGRVESGAVLLHRSTSLTTFLWTHTHTHIRYTGKPFLPKVGAQPSIFILVFFPLSLSLCLVSRMSCSWGRSWCLSPITASLKPRRAGCSPSSWAPSPWLGSPCTWVLPSAWGWCSSPTRTAQRWSTTSGCTAWTTRRTSSR